MTTLEDLATRVRSLSAGGRRAILGVTGSPGAGKTTFAKHLVRLLQQTSPAPGQPERWAVHVPMDGYHLADVELDRLGRRARKGAPDTFDAAGYAALLRRVRDDHDDVIYAPAFERDIEQPIAGSIPIPRSARLIVSEGNYLLFDQPEWKQVRLQFDEVWFCELDADERVRRLVARHERFGKNHDAAVAWVMGTDQRNADLIDQTRRHADLIVPASLIRPLADLE